MKKPLLLILAAACGMLSAQEDRVPSGLVPLTTKGAKKPNEVTVVLDPPAPRQARPSPSRPSPAPTKDSVPSAPSLIENASALPAPEVDLDEVAAPAEKRPDVKVHVEKLQTPSGPVDPGKVQLLAPFPAKPLSAIPKGWKLDSTGTAPPFTREVEVSPGSKITLNIRPHVLIPDTDGATTFTVAEPGYEAPLGYQQKDTVGAILSNSIRELDEDSKQMGDAIERLQQLLISLPKATEPAAVEKPPVARPVLRQ